MDLGNWVVKIAGEMPSTANPVRPAAQPTLTGFPICCGRYARTGSQGPLKAGVLSPIDENIVGESLLTEIYSR